MRLSEANATVSELAKPFDMALPSFMQHLRVLEKSNLVRSHKVGRARTYELHTESLEMVQSWLEKRKSIWEKRLDKLDSYLLEMKD